MNEPATPSRSGGPLLGLRVVATVLALAFMWGGPAYRQMFGGHSRYMPRWIMFSGKGLGVIDADFFRADEAGNLDEINHFEVLGVPWPYRSGDKNLWRFTNQEQARKVARKVCEKLGPEAHVYIAMRQAVPTGWETLEQADIDWCGPKAKATARRLDRQFKKEGKLRYATRLEAYEKRKKKKKKKKKKKNQARITGVDSP